LSQVTFDRNLNCRARTSLDDTTSISETIADQPSLVRAPHGRDNPRGNGIAPMGRSYEDGDDEKKPRNAGLFLYSAKPGFA